VKKLSPYLKMQVLAAIDYADGTSRRARIENVAGMMFKDEDGNLRQFTWRTIQTWYSRYQKHGITSMEPKKRSDSGVSRKITPEQLLEAINQALPLFRGTRYNKMDIYRKIIEKGIVAQSMLAPTTFFRFIREYELLSDKDASDNKRRLADKRLVVVTVARTLHTYTNTIKIMCEAFNVEYDGTHFKCERRLIDEALALYRSGKLLVIIIDDAHLMEITTLRRLRLLLEDFPRNHNLILVGHPELLSHMSLKVNEDLKTRVTYSVVLKKLVPDDMAAFILSQLDKAGLGHNIFTEEALSLIVRSADGILRRARNLCLSSMLEAVRDRKKSIDLPIVNRVLIQPHWRLDYEIERN
jgi:MSHA biogenesis protein MshM